MDIKLQIILIVIFALVLLVIFGLIRKKKIELKYGLPWIIALVILLIFSIFPHILIFLAGVLSIATPINALVLFGFIFMSCIILTQAIIISKISNNVKNLAQQMALLEHKVEEKKE